MVGERPYLPFLKKKKKKKNNGGTSGGGEGFGGGSKDEAMRVDLRGDQGLWNKSGQIRNGGEEDENKT